MNLLIVDDEYYTVEASPTNPHTRPDFFEIFCAYNLTQALEAFSAHPIDLMICDIETARRFRPRTAGPDPPGTLRNRLHFSDRLCKI